jgi:hypothetical protein
MTLKSAEQFFTLEKSGELENFAGAAGTLPSSGLLVNCPAIAVLK